jgi:DNA-directed RNA polymerase subunit RPC12/RpoP
MPVPFECDHCHAAYEVAEELSGKEVLCRECEKRSLVVDYAGRYVSFVCPNCRQQTEVPAAFAGRWMRCPGCEKLANVPVASKTRFTRRRILIAAGGAVLVSMTALGLFAFLGHGKNSGASERPPRGQSRGRSQDNPGGKDAGQQKGKRAGRRGRGRQGKAPI